jgi:hypothetical protein
MREEWHQGKICFGEITGTKVTDPETALGSSTDEDGFSCLDAKNTRTVQRTKLFLSTKRLEELWSQTWV